MALPHRCAASLRLAGNLSSNLAVYDRKEFSKASRRRSLKSDRSRQVEDWPRSGEMFIDPASKEISKLREKRAEWSVAHKWAQRHNRVCWCGYKYFVPTVLVRNELVELIS